jgi:hypothetical protein
MWNRIKPINNGLNIKPEMPEEGQEVLFWDDGVHMGYYQVGQFFDKEYRAWEPTHWQPLPGEPFNHIEGECTHKECVSYCPSLEKE